MSSERAATLPKITRPTNERWVDVGVSTSTAVLQEGRGQRFELESTLTERILFEPKFVLRNRSNKRADADGRSREGGREGEREARTMR